MRVDQYQRYKTSIHGKRLDEGDEKAAVCTDCHTIHQMRPVKNPFYEYWLDQYSSIGKNRVRPGDFHQGNT